MNPNQEMSKKSYKSLSKRQINKLNKQRNDESDLENDDNKSIGISSDYSSMQTTSTLLTGDSTESINDFDLYKQDGSLTYIKQKYKMYLDWLNENSKKSKSSKRGQKQLSWYTYEKHFHKNDYLKYLKTASLNKEEKFEHRLSDPQLKINNFSSTSCLNLQAGTASFISSTSEPGPLITTERKDSKAKGVKFESVNNLSSSSFTSSAITNSTTNLKPILKSKQYNPDIQNPYLKNRLSANSPKRTQSQFKLPPILVQCSEDFYAVLRDLEKEK